MSPVETWFLRMLQQEPHPARDHGATKAIRSNAKMATIADGAELRINDKSLQKLVDLFS